MMDMTKLIRIGVFLVFTTPFMIGCLRLFEETPSKIYQNYEEVIADGAIQRGWIPEFLPVSAVNIFEKHNLDTNESILKFNFDTTELETLRQHCQPVNTTTTPKLWTDWWSNDTINLADNQLYCSDYGAYLVVHGNTAYYWR